MRYCLRIACHALCAATLVGLGTLSVGSATPLASAKTSQKVTKDDVEALLKSGPHAMIRSFLVEPAYKDKKFLGFRLIQRTPHPVLSASGPVRTGDIIVSANGVRLETPAQYMAAWGKLKTERAFSVVLLRNGQRVTLKWTLDES
ncbi:MAG: hypothetical protein ACPGQS_04415 [Bradymonadia bacterium]